MASSPTTWQRASPEEHSQAGAPTPPPCPDGCTASPTAHVMQPRGASRITRFSDFANRYFGERW